MIQLPPAKLKGILVGQELIDPGTFDSLENEAQRKRQNLTDVLVSQGIINKDYLYAIIAKSLGVERANLGTIKIDEKILQSLSEDTARRRRVIVFGREANGTFDVAMDDPTDLETIDFLKLRLGGPVKSFLATDEDLNRGFSLYEAKLTKDFKKVIEESVKESLRSKAKGDLEEAAADLPVVAIVDNLLAYAYSSRASDIHFEVLDDVILVRYRVDGVLHEIIRMPKEIHPAVVARIKILSNLRVDEHTHPQDGRFRYKIGDEIVDIRVSVIPTFYGEKVELRLLAAAQKPLSFGELGMFEETEKVLKEAIKKSYGMVLICGPTGSGKTTTLYSIMNVLNRPEVNIVTVEDPIEYDMRYANQVQVNVQAGITFANGLRSILRQDPNIIMVGEIRDPETANIAVQAALTGHLMLSSLHTNDASTAIPRLVDMGIPSFLTAAVLNAVSAQRLARKIHLDCIESYAPEPGIVMTIKNTLKELGVNPETYRVPKTFYRGRGCNACNHTGYYGRVGLFEVLDITEPVRRAIVDPTFNLDALRKLAREQGMVTIFEDGLKKVERGLTTVDELFRVIRE
ncbi:MAG: type II/IV secretion system protein [Candidatus Brennerbacteria bacterium]|nr:type II/IV secretion system protein [Candidatus Brennerbacteria bacterium]